MYKIKFSDNLIASKTSDFFIDMKLYLNDKCLELTDTYHFQLYSNNVLVLEKELQVDAEEDILMLYIPKSDFDNIQIGTYDLKIKIETGSEVYNISDLKFTIKE